LFLCVIFATSILFSVIITPLQSSWGEKTFKENFDAKQKGAEVLSLDEWSDYFAGGFGLQALERLSQDPNLMPSGRRIATEIRNHILSGRHQQHLLTLLHHGWYVWPISCAIAYVYIVDGLQTGHWTKAPAGPVFPY
jgi:hypothetical protein